MEYKPGDVVIARGKATRSNVEGKPDWVQWGEHPSWKDYYRKVMVLGKTWKHNGRIFSPGWTSGDETGPDWDPGGLAIDSVTMCYMVMEIQPGNRYRIPFPVLPEQILTLEQYQEKYEDLARVVVRNAIAYRWWYATDNVHRTKVTRRPYSDFVDEESSKKFDLVLGKNRWNCTGEDETIAKLVACWKAEDSVEALINEDPVAV